MIDASNITDFNLDTEGLETRILFWVTAAGKSGAVSAKLLDTFLKRINGKDKPFKTIKALDKEKLVSILKDVGIGCYTHKARTMLELANSELDLNSCSAEELEKIYGIGMKTSRCFILHSRKDSKYAGLDTHILKHLRANGIEDVPKSTPTSKKQYLRLEYEVLRLAKEAGMSPADYDLRVWNKYSVK